MAGGTWKPRARRHGNVYVQKTVTNFLTMGTNANYAKRRPAVITAIATDTNPDFRVRHHGETYGTGAVGVPRRFSGNRANKYVPQ